MTNDISKSWFAGVLPEYWDNLDSVQSQVCDPMLQKLFRIFLMLSERSCEKQNKGSRKSYLWIHSEEVQLFASILSHHLPAVRCENANGYCQHGFYHYCGLNGGLLSVSDTKQDHTFKEFAMILARIFPYDREEFMLALLIAYDNLINQVLKKGFLLWSSRKPGSCLHTWQRRWAVIKPGLISFYRDQSEQQKLKDVFLTNDTTIGILESKSPLTANGSPLYEFELQISCGKRRYIATFDILQRRQWITALQYASRNPSSQQPPNSASNNIHRRAFLKRRQLRIDKSGRTTLSEPPAAQVSTDVPLQGTATNGPVIASNSVCTSLTETATTSKLAQERLSGTADERDDEGFWQNLTVEALCKELEKERLRANRLALEKKRVQDQLEKERLAIKDEEIVRSLATRLLEEERAQRASLEETTRHCMEQLEEERRYRQALEAMEQLRQEEIQRLKEDLQRLHSRVLSNQTAGQKLTADERLELIAKLKRDQEALLKQQMEIRNELMLQQLDCSQRFEEAKNILGRLMENSKKRSQTTLKTFGDPRSYQM